MSKRKPIDLTLQLRRLGLTATESESEELLPGFPIRLSGAGGSQATLWIDEPPFAGHAEMGFGVAWLTDLHARVISSWGDESTFPRRPRPGDELHNGLRELHKKTLRIGHASAYLDGYRVYATRARDAKANWVLFVACDAGDEALARRNAALAARQVDALKRIGRSMAMSQTLQPLVLSAAHTICDALDLAGALLWVKNSEEMPLELVSSVGIDRQGLQHVGTLEIDNAIDNLAELSVSLGKTVLLSRIEDSPLGNSFESRWCYVRVGGVFVTPLTIQSKLLGVLELIGRKDDDTFSQSLDVMEAVAEQLAMALNGAIMFEGVEKLATIDPLTGISNHRTMQQFLARRTQEAERSQGTLGVVMVDVDHFRSFNEEEGHDAGDKVLRMVADVLKQSLRPYDLAARYGGEEFTLILPNVHREQLVHIAERIRQGLEQLIFVGSNGKARHLSASFGCSLFPESGGDPAALLKAADIALYQAKNQGRNRTVFYEPGATLDQSGQPLDLSRLKRYVSPKRRKESETLLDSAELSLDFLEDRGILNPQQKQQARGAVYLYLTWIHAVRQGLEQDLQRLQSAQEMRAIVPVLLAMPERFDGAGPWRMKAHQIPLVSRAVSIVLARIGAPEWYGTKDSGRFDPELMEILAQVPRAA